MAGNKRQQPSDGCNPNIDNKRSRTSEPGMYWLAGGLWQDWEAPPLSVANPDEQPGRIHWWARQSDEHFSAPLLSNGGGGSGAGNPHSGPPGGGPPGGGPSGGGPPGDGPPGGGPSGGGPSRDGPPGGGPPGGSHPPPPNTDGGPLGAGSKSNSGASQPVHNVLHDNGIDPAVVEASQRFIRQDPDGSYHFLTTISPGQATGSVQPPQAYTYSPQTDPRDNLDQTTFLAGQADWSAQTLPGISGILDPMSILVNTQPPAYLAIGTVVQTGTWIIKLRDLPVLPPRISHKVEGWRMDAWMRTDGRVTYEDILARMDREPQWVDLVNRRGNVAPTWLTAQEKGNKKMVLNKLRKRITDHYDKSGGMRRPASGIGDNDQVPRQTELLCLKDFSDEQILYNTRWEIIEIEGNRYMHQTQPPRGAGVPDRCYGLPGYPGGAAQNLRVEDTKLAIEASKLAAAKAGVAECDWEAWVIRNSRAMNTRKKGAGSNTQQRGQQQTRSQQAPQPVLQQDPGVPVLRVPQPNPQQIVPVPVPQHSQPGAQPNPQPGSQSNGQFIAPVAQMLPSTNPTSSDPNPTTTGQPSQPSTSPPIDPQLLGQYY